MKIYLILMGFGRRLLALPVIVFFIFAIAQYARVDLDGINAAGSILLGEATLPLPIDAKISTDKIDFRSRADDVSVEFLPMASSLEVDGKRVKPIGDLSSISASGFEGMFSIYSNGTVSIDGSAESFVLGDIAFSRSKITATVISGKASFSGISSSMVDKKAKGTVAIGTAKMDFDGKIRITSFRGSVSLSDGSISMKGNASRVSVDSGFKANFS